MARKRTRIIARYPFVVNGNKAVAVNAHSLDNAIDRVLALNPGKVVTTTYARNMEKYLTRLNDKERVLVTRYNNGVSAASLITEEDLMESLMSRKETKVKHKFFMELQKAIKQAIQLSKDKKDTYYVNVVEAGEPNEGDCNVEKEWDHTTYAAYRNGSEIAVPVKAKQAEKPSKKTAKVQAESETNNKTKSKTMAKVIAQTAPTKGKGKVEKVEKEVVAPKKAAKETVVAKAPKGKKNLTVKEIIKLTKAGTKVLNHADKVLTLGYLEKMKDHSRQMPVSY